MGDANGMILAGALKANKSIRNIRCAIVPYQPRAALLDTLVY